VDRKAYEIAQPQAEETLVQLEIAEAVLGLEEVVDWPRVTERTTGKAST
jgi:hypothetical protein